MSNSQAPQDTVEWFKRERLHLIEFAKAIDMAFDGSGNGLGTRSKRYSMLVDDGVVKKLNIEDAPGKCEISGGQAKIK